MPEEEGAQHTVSVLPWLRLAESVEIDEVGFWPFPAMKNRFDSNGTFDPQLQRILGGYVDVEGNPVRRRA